MDVEFLFSLLFQDYFLVCMYVCVCLSFLFNENCAWAAFV